MSHTNILGHTTKQMVCKYEINQRWCNYLNFKKQMLKNISTSNISGQSSYVYSVEYFGVRSTINRTKMISNNEIICKDCEYLEDDRKNNDLINNHR